MPLDSVWKGKLSARASELGPHTSDNKPCTHAFLDLRVCIECSKLSCIECGIESLEYGKLICRCGANSMCAIHEDSSLTEWTCGACMSDAFVDFEVCDDVDEDEDAHDEIGEDELVDLGEHGVTIIEPQCKHCKQPYTECSCEEFGG